MNESEATSTAESQRRLAVAANYEHATEECDLIMKGGITSGIVYPRAACHLAAKYRFKHLGGASAGAIAATFVAAAEYGRDAGGFVELNKLPDDLGTSLPTLFQPSRKTRPAYAVLTAWIEPGRGIATKIAVALGRVVQRAPFAFVASLMLALLPGFAVAATSHEGPGIGDWARLARAMLVWLPGALVIAFIAAIALVVVRTLRALPENGYGLCVGHADDGGGNPPLTDWMTHELDKVAGLGDDEGPLTFGHLWGADGVAAFRLLAERENAGKRIIPEERRLAGEARNIDLQVVTTNLTFRRPYQFPFSTDIFFYCEEHLKIYFPKLVVDHMRAHSTEVPDAIDTGAPGNPSVSTVCPCHGVRVRYLPAAPDIPLVVAARLSLSFPGLVSAVPLFCIDWSRGPGYRELIEVWFSDGGISSNFPMHLFDALWPKRPTFGINLQPMHPDYPGQFVWRPKNAVGGIVPRSHAMGSMIGFLQSILDTMQNWRDSTEITMPGFRDRVTELRHSHDEGGMNLKMRPETIKLLANRGADAAAEFDDFDLDLHRWTRYRVAASAIDDVLDHMHSRNGGPGGYENFVATHGPGAPSYAYETPADVAADSAATAELMNTALDWQVKGHPATAGNVPHPRPSLRTVPPQ